MKAIQGRSFWLPVLGVAVLAASSLSCRMVGSGPGVASDNRAGGLARAASANARNGLGTGKSAGGPGGEGGTKTSFVYDRAGQPIGCRITNDQGEYDEQRDFAYNRLGYLITNGVVGGIREFYDRNLDGSIRVANVAGGGIVPDHALRNTHEERSGVRTGFTLEVGRANRCVTTTLDAAGRVATLTDGAVRADYTWNVYCAASLQLSVLGVPALQLTNAWLRWSDLRTNIVWQLPDAPRGPAIVAAFGMGCQSGTSRIVSIRREDGSLRALSFDQDNRLLTWAHLRADGTRAPAGSHVYRYGQNGQTLCEDVEASGGRSARTQPACVFDGSRRLREAVIRTGRQLVRATYDYYPDWRRARKTLAVWSRGAWRETTTHQYLYDGSTLIREVVTQGNRTIRRDYTWGLDLAGLRTGCWRQEAGGIGGLLAITEVSGTTTNIYLPFCDQVGTICGLVAVVTGNVRTPPRVIAGPAYAPYGEMPERRTDSAAVCPFGFQSKYWDEETGFWYFGFRYYDPREHDWVGASRLDLSMFDLTSFCRGDPVNVIDPLGEVPEW